MQTSCSALEQDLPTGSRVSPRGHPVSWVPSGALTRLSVCKAANGP